MEKGAEAPIMLPRPWKPPPALCGDGGGGGVAPKLKQALASGTAATALAPKPPKLEAAALPPIIGVGRPCRPPPAAKEGGGAAPGAPEQGLAEPNAKCPPLDGGGAPKDGGGAAL